MLLGLKMESQWFCLLFVVMCLTPCFTQLNWLVGQAGFTGNKVTLEISDTCWHLSFQPNLRDELAKTFWNLSREENLLTWYANPSTSKQPPVLGRFQEGRNPPVPQPVPALPAHSPLQSWVLAGARKDLTSRASFTWTLMRQGHPQQAWCQASCPKSPAALCQQKSASLAVLCAGVAKLPPW